MAQGNFKTAKAVKLGLLILVLLAGGVVLYRSCNADKAPSYMTVQPQVRDIVKQVFATGTVEGSTEVDVGAQVSGQILTLHVKTGDEVKKGDLLCEIDPKIQENTLRAAEAEVLMISAKIRAKEAEIKKLSADYKRKAGLKKIDATSKQELEASEAAYEIAKAELDQLNAQYTQDLVSVDDAKTNLGYTKITAPMDGTVYGVVVSEGQTVNANQTTPTILRMAVMDTVVVKTEISEADVVNVAPGMECTFTVLGLPYREFKAVLGRVAPAPSSYESSSSTSSSSSSSSSTAIYYNADLLVENEDRVLRKDMTADVTINIDSRSQVLALPLTALRSEGSDTATIYVLDDQKQVRERQVGIGIRDDRFVEITSGLESGESVVIGDDVQTAEQAAMQNDRRPRGPF